MRKYALLAALVLTGCTTSPQDCDLHAQDPSFITKLSCATSGGYRQQVDQKEQQVRLSQYQNESAKQQQDYTQNRQQTLNQKLADEQARLNAVSSDLSQTLAKLKSSKIQSRERQQETAVATMKRFRWQAILALAVGIPVMIWGMAGDHMMVMPGNQTTWLGI